MNWFIIYLFGFLIVTIWMTVANVPSLVQEKVLSEQGKFLEWNTLFLVMLFANFFLWWLFVPMYFLQGLQW